MEFRIKCLKQLGTFIYHFNIPQLSRVVKTKDANGRNRSLLRVYTVLQLR